MTQMRTFLILAWLMVAGLLWFEWGKYQDAKLRPAPEAAAVTVPSVAPLPGAPATAAGGATSQPRRQPVMPKYLEKLLSTKASSSTSSTLAASQP